MAHNNKHCPDINGKCSKIMPYWDNHSVCRACRNYACSPTSTCEVCADWSEELWKFFSKCLRRASQARSFKPRCQTSSHVPENGPGRSCSSHVSAKDLGKDSSSLFRGSTSVSSATISTTEASDHHQLQQGMPSSDGEDSLQGSDGEPDRDSPSRDPSPDRDLSVDQDLGSRPAPCLGLEIRVVIRATIVVRGAGHLQTMTRHRLMFLGVDPGINTRSQGIGLDLGLGLGIVVIITVRLDPRDLGVGIIGLGHLDKGQDLDVLGPDNTDTGLGLVLDTSSEDHASLVEQQGQLLKELSSRMDKFSNSSSSAQDSTEKNVQKR